MKFSDIFHRRPQHVGVINQAMWSAHARGVPMLTMENNSTDITCVTHPNHIVIPITDGTYQCSGCLSNDVCRDLELAN